MDLSGSYLRGLVYNEARREGEMGRGSTRPAVVG